MSTTDRFDRPPTVGAPASLVQVSERVWVLPDAERTPHVPNVGFVIGERAVLIVDSGLGVENADRVFAALRSLTDRERVYLTQTHFHPEHGYGAQRLQDRVTVVYNAPQFAELQEKGQLFLEMFRGFSEHIAAALADVVFIKPDIVYGGAAELELGELTVELTHQGPAHTRGDQSVHIPAEGVLFTGDLVEERFFPILPDDDASMSRWIAALVRLEALSPSVVVPGHGALGAFDLLRGYRETLDGWRAQAVELAGQGRSADEVDRELTEQILRERPDWDNREWVGPMVRKSLER
jgi:glyoxylase-like metal-dependent hydrolase (beta-lactamase superfamily II)